MKITERLLKLFDPQLATRISQMSGLSPSNVGGVFRPQSNQKGQLGATGLANIGGYIYDEFLQELRGSRGRKVFREMKDNDATVGAVLSAIQLLCLSVPIDVQAAEGDTTGEYAAFAKEQLSDMESTWNDTLSEILSMLPYGFSVMEMTFKYRRGNNPDSKLSSRFEDGRLGIQYLAPRAQESIERWDLDPEGRFLGLIQDLYLVGAMPATNKASSIYIPGDRVLLFRMRSEKNNPEGRSILRNCYTSYYYMKKFQLIEAIAIEREMAGIPVVSIPSSVFGDATKLAAWEKVASDLKANSQGGLVIPSDLWRDPETGNLTGTRQYEVALVTSGGTRSIDINNVIGRYQGNIARTALADFLVLGSNSSSGSYALSKDKTPLFIRGVESVMDCIVEEMNRKLLPTLWQLNMLPKEMMPRYKYGQIGPVDLTELSTYLTALSSVGVTLLDPASEEYLRRQAGIPNADALDGGGSVGG